MKLMSDNNMLQNPLFSNFFDSFMKNPQATHRRPSNAERDEELLAKMAEMARNYQRKRMVGSVVQALRKAHQVASQKKEYILGQYIVYCAIKIQKVFRGYLARKYKKPMEQAFGPKQRALLAAAALGWKTRKIMKLKEVEKRASMVRDHDNSKLDEIIGGGFFNEKMFKESRKNSCRKLSLFVRQMHDQGQWLLVHRGSDFKGPIPSKRGSNQNRPSQMSPVRNDQRKDEARKESPTRMVMSFQGNNRFQPDFSNEEYKKAASDSFKKRMHYDPVAARKRKPRSPSEEKKTSKSLIHGRPYQSILDDGPQHKQEVRTSLPDNSAYNKRSTLNQYLWCLSDSKRGNTSLINVSDEVVLEKPGKTEEPRDTRQRKDRLESREK